MEHELQHAMFEVPDSFDVHTVLMDGDIDTGKLLYVWGWWEGEGKRERVSCWDGGREGKGEVGKGRRRCDRMGEGVMMEKWGSGVWADSTWLCVWMVQCQGDPWRGDVRGREGQEAGHRHPHGKHRFS